MSISEHDRAAIMQCSRDSLAATRPFPDIVAGLSAAGMGSYFSDYRSGRTTYYARTGDPVSMPLPTEGGPISKAFDANALQAAIKGSQQGEIRYPDFLDLSRKAGCVGYHVWIDGRHVTYFGQQGEIHVERFPGAN